MSDQSPSPTSSVLTPTRSNVEHLPVLSRISEGEESLSNPQKRNDGNKDGVTQTKNKGLESEYLPSQNRPPYFDSIDSNTDPKSPFALSTNKIESKNLSPNSFKKLQRHSSLDPSKQQSSSTSLSSLTSPFLRRHSTTAGGATNSSSITGSSDNAGQNKLLPSKSGSNHLLSTIESSGNLSSNSNNLVPATGTGARGAASSNYNFLTASKNPSIHHRPKTTFINCPSTIQASLNLMFNNNYKNSNGRDSVTVNMNNINGSMLQYKNASTSMSSSSVANAQTATPLNSSNHNNQDQSKNNQTPNNINNILSMPKPVIPTWRLKERMKTVGIGLILALNIGTDPPDIHKPNPCAKLICWMDPTSASRAKVRDQIGELLKNQYFKWQGQQRTRLKHKIASDPTKEDVRNLCFSMRRAARNERLLLHYNGHGVPRPTANGEIWVFDRHHRQYIPLAVGELRNWIGKPSLIVLDCSGAGALMPFLTSNTYPHQGSFLNPVDGDTIVENTPFGGLNLSEGDRAGGLNNATRGGTPVTSASTQLPGPVTEEEKDPVTEEEKEAAYAAETVREFIVLCPTAASENLPMNPELPADLFTSCLTTPIQIALRWFVHQNPLSCTGVSPDDVDLIPGELADRKTPLGELNWIFTAVTDNIAWNVLPSALFQRLFRQDLLVASMFRNFLLADRILRGLNCTPMSHPALPPTCDHPLWQAWDLAIETCLSQLMRDGVFNKNQDQNVEKNEEGLSSSQHSGVIRASSDGVLTTKMNHHAAGNHDSLNKLNAKKVFTSSTKSAPFFSEQLTAFEVWLDFAANRIKEGGVILNPPKKRNTCVCGPFDIESPDQLPVVLQVLLSPAHRVRALILLRRFLNLGNSAVNLALSVGIFPYVLRLLQSQIDEYKHVLVGIWNKILEFDPSCQVDLVKDHALSHFINHLNWGSRLSLDRPQSKGNSFDISSSSKEDVGNQKTMAAVILSAICFGYPNGQTECMKNNLHGTCCSILRSIEKDKNDSNRKMREKGKETDDQIPAKFRMWLCICLGVMFDNVDAGKDKAFQSEVHLRLFSRTRDESSQVRAAACFALGSLVGPSGRRLIKKEDLSMDQPSTIIRGPTQILSPSPLSYNTSSPQQGLSPLGNLMMQTQQSATHTPPTLQPIQQYSNLPYTPTNSGGLFPERNQNGSSFMPSLHPPLVTTPPSVFEEKNVLGRDLMIIEKMINMCSDACPTVRFEATVVLGKAIDRYLMAFVCVANVTLPSRNGHVAEANPIVMPDGVDLETENLFNKTWKLMRFLHDNDPHPQVASAATAVLKFVNEHILLLKSRYTQNQQLRSNSERRLDIMGIGNNDSDERSNKKKYLRTNSAFNLGTHSRSISQPSGQMRLSSLHEVNESDESEMSTSPRIQSPSTGPLNNDTDQDLDEHLRIDSMNILPSSKFYEWKKKLFEEEGNKDNLDNPDPLSADGALHLYRAQRNDQIDKSCSQMSASFEILQPKRKKQNLFDSLTSFDSNSELLDLDDDDSKEKEIDSKTTTKKKALHLKEKSLLYNDDKTKGTYMLRFHSYESLLASSDGSSCVTIWDIDRSKKASQIFNCNPIDTRMTTMHWINERNNSLLLTGCDDGSVRVYDNSIKNATNMEEHAKLSTAFYAMPELEPHKRRSGLVTEWQQSRGRLVAGGNTNMIRCWDLESEKCSAKIETNRVSACLTSFATAFDYVHSTCDTHGFSGISPDVVLSGYSDGVIRIIDLRAQNPKEGSSSSRRKSSRRRREQEMIEHTHWIVNLCFTECGSNHEIVSGSILGDVKFWDLRNLRSSVDTHEVQRKSMTAFVSHPRIPLLASGSHANFVKLFSPDGDFLQLIRQHHGCRRKIGPVSVLAFHPNKLMLAAGTTDEIISIYDSSKAAKW